MQAKENRVQTAFILSIIGSSGVDPLLLFFVTPYDYFGFSFFSNAALTFVAMPLFFFFFFLGGVALSLIKDANASALHGKYKVFNILARIFSIIAIVEGAILSTIGLVYLLHSLFSFIGA